jgi:hypothetical protein
LDSWNCRVRENIRRVAWKREEGSGCRPYLYSLILTLALSESVNCLSILICLLSLTLYDGSLVEHPWISSIPSNHLPNNLPRVDPILKFYFFSCSIGLRSTEYMKYRTYTEFISFFIPPSGRTLYVVLYVVFGGLHSLFCFGSGWSLLARLLFTVSLNVAYPR